LYLVHHYCPYLLDTTLSCDTHIWHDHGGSISSSKSDVGLTLSWSEFDLSAATLTYVTTRQADCANSADLLSPTTYTLHKP
jgi:hypothetical protein